MFNSCTRCSMFNFLAAPTFSMFVCTRAHMHRQPCNQVSCLHVFAACLRVFFVVVWKRESSPAQVYTTMSAAWDLSLVAPLDYGLAVQMLLEDRWPPLCIYRSGLHSVVDNVFSLSIDHSSLLIPVALNLCVLDVLLRSGHDAARPHAADVSSGQ